MWPWQRTRRADHPAGGVTAEVVSPGVVARRSEWATLPPIQRAVDTLRPVAPPQEFHDALVSWRNPSFLAPLGHLVSADAPAGVIHRLIEPAVPPHDHQTAPPLIFVTPPPRPPRPSLVQRMLAAFSPPATFPTTPHSPPNNAPQDAPNRNSAPNGGLEYPVHRYSAPNGGRQGDGGSPAVVQRSGGAALALTQAPAPVLPVLELPVVAGPPAVAESVLTEGSAQIVRGSEPHAGGDEHSPHSELPPPVDSAGGEVPTLGAAPVLPTVARSVADDASAGTPMIAARTQVPPSMPPAPGSAGGAGTSRRLGLGPPLAPDAVTAQRNRAVPPSSATSPGSATWLPQSPWVAVPQFHVQPVDGPQVVEPEGNPQVAEAELVERTAPSPPSVSAEIAPLLGESGSVPMLGNAVASSERALPVLREHDAAVSPADQLAPPADTSPLAATPVPLSATPALASATPALSAPPVVARLVGDRLPSLLTVPSPTHGSTDRGWVSQQSGEVLASGMSSGVPSVQLTPVESPRRSDGHGRGVGHADEQLAPIRVPSAGLGAPFRAASYPHGGPVALSSREHSGQLTPVEQTVQRSARLTSPGQLPPVVSVVPRHAQVMPMAPVVHALPPEPALSQVVQRQAIPAPSIEPVPSAESVPDVVAEAGTDPPGMPGQASAAAAAGGAAAGSPEEMAKKLFDPLLRRLKTELRLDRERRGTLTDLRH